jgi:hypothetical protein
MPSFLSHFPIFCAFFSTKTTDSVVTSGSHFLRTHKKKGLVFLIFGIQI